VQRRGETGKESKCVGEDMYVPTIMQGRKRRSGEVSKIEVIIKEESAGKNPHVNGGMEQIIEQITSVNAESLPPKSPWSANCHLPVF